MPVSTTLDGTGTGTFKVAWSPSDNKAVVLGDGLADPGPGKAYELWLIDGDGRPRRATSSTRPTVSRCAGSLPVDGSPTQWAITVEPEGGVDQATGDIIFAGAVVVQLRA